MSPLPPALNPLVTTHPASCAWRIFNECVGFSWPEQEAMARAIVELDRERAELRQKLADGEVERNRLQAAELKVAVGRIDQLETEIVEAGGT